MCPRGISTRNQIFHPHSTVPAECRRNRQRLVLENMRLAVVHPSSSDLSFHSSLFKMQTDHLSFERFEELFEGDDDDTPAEPPFDSEWSRCENLFMHTNQPAVFVIVADVMEFFDKITQSVKFLVSYEVKSDLMTARLTLNAGEVKFDFRTICGQESELKLTTAEVYKDLLAITSTSPMLRLELKFEKPPKLKFAEFLKSSLSFVQLTNEWKPENPENLTMDQSRLCHTERMETDCADVNPARSEFFYASDGYFRGMLVRLQLSGETNVAMKVYQRSHHQIVTFARAINSKYPERCTVVVNKSAQLNQFRNLIAEINSNSN